MSMRGLRREMPGRTARRATLRARHTRIQVVKSRITGGAIIYEDMSSRTILREWRAGTGQIDVCDYLCSRRNERGIREKLREEAPWVPCVGRIGIWNFPADDDDGMDASSSRWTISTVGQQTGVFFVLHQASGYVEV